MKSRTIAIFIILAFFACEFRTAPRSGHIPLRHVATVRIEPDEPLVTTLNTWLRAHSDHHVLAFTGVSDGRSSFASVLITFDQGPNHPQSFREIPVDDRLGPDLSLDRFITDNPTLRVFALSALPRFGGGSTDKLILCVEQQ